MFCRAPIESCQSYHLVVTRTTMSFIVSDSKDRSAFITVYPPSSLEGHKMFHSSGCKYCCSSIIDRGRKAARAVAVLQDAASQAKAPTFLTPQMKSTVPWWLVPLSPTCSLVGLHSSFPRDLTYGQVGLTLSSISYTNATGRRSLFEPCLLVGFDC